MESTGKVVFLQLYLTGKEIVFLKIWNDFSSTLK